jgi:hypothetical protein
VLLSCFRLNWAGQNGPKRLSTLLPARKALGPRHYCSSRTCVPCAHGQRAHRVLNYAAHVACVPRQMCANNGSSISAPTSIPAGASMSAEGTSKRGKKSGPIAARAEADASAPAWLGFTGSRDRRWLLTQGPQRARCGGTRDLKQWKGADHLMQAKA